MGQRITAERILETTRQYQAACIITAAAELDIFEHLSTRQGLTVEELSLAAGTNQRALAVLLDALSALGIIAKCGDRYSLKEETARLLTSGGSKTVLSMVLHQANCLRRWSRLAWVVKNGASLPHEESIRGREEDLASFIGAMDNVSAPVAQDIITSLGEMRFSHLLDVGGASGTWTISWLKLYPASQATIFDLPPVIEMAKEKIEASGLADRVQFAAGDYNSDNFPGGSDLIWLSAVTHQQSREKNRSLLRRLQQALLPGGRILIRDIVMKEDRIQPAAGALFAVNMLVGTEDGGTYTFDEYREDLERAGFAAVSLLRDDPSMHSVISALRN